MDIQIQELIDKIKKDAIESGSAEAARIKKAAEGEAQSIVENAKKEAEGIVSRAKTDAERSEKAGNAALGQASRNLLLAFKGEIQALLDKIIEEALSSSYGDDTLKQILPEIVKTWAAKGSDTLDIVLAGADLKKLEGYFTEKLAAELKKGVELKSDRNLAAGFRIVNKDGSAYFDFSAEAVAELLSAYLNPRLAGILKTAAKG
ncbi:MAG: V-type ATP synthase subunit E [Treponema sp.]|jgi:V/A-type H+-transporting ATPase subunit E|nr:V-type ATP synthase subunit E [Treponema sp.]